MSRTTMSVAAIVLDVVSIAGCAGSFAVVWSGMQGGHAQGDEAGALGFCLGAASLLLALAGIVVAAFSFRARGEGVALPITGIVAGALATCASLAAAAFALLALTINSIVVG
jgi:hypothetical protein